jgi:hypothetical protein
MYKIFLKELEEPIQVLWDLSMFDFFRDSLRGGYCSVGEITYANVCGKKDECIVNLDMNSLYPTAMRFPMPHSEFTWISGEEGERILYDSHYNWEKDDYGYWLEVDIECPKEIHDKVATYPLFPEKINGKLMATLRKKKYYRSHIANLRLGLELGYKIIRVHRGIRFHQ